METSQFTNDMPGRFTSIPDGYAFIPDPPKWEFPDDLWPLLSDARDAVALLEGVGRGLTDPALLLHPVQSREAIQSSKIEGTNVTPHELLMYEIDPQEPKTAEEDAGGWQEVSNYRRALQHGIHSDLPFSKRLIRDLHKILMTGVRGKGSAPGQFRRLQVAIGTRFVPPPANEVGPCLDAFEKYIHGASPFPHPLVDCFLAHYQFEAIHPFLDGNGRVGRLLLALMLKAKCKLTKPWLYLSEFFEPNRNEYCDLLFNVSARGEWRPWIEFCLRGTIERANATVERCDKLRALHLEFTQRLSTVGGSIRLNEIVEKLFKTPYVVIASLPDRFDVTYPTGKADVQRLIDAGILEELGDVSPKMAYAPELFEIAYGGID